MKRLVCAILALILIAGSFHAAASDDPNMGGGSGGTGTARPGWAWNGTSAEGVRISVIERSTKIKYGESMDWSNNPPGTGTFSFRKKCKLEYHSPGDLEFVTSYVCIKPGKGSLPPIIQHNNIEQIKSFFRDAEVKAYVLQAVNLPESANHDDYDIMVEPIAFFTVNYQRYAMTATEMAYFNKRRAADGETTLRGNIGALTHKSAPISLFLERPAWGIAPWSGAVSTSFSDGIYYTDDQIIHQLGVGQVPLGADPSDSDAFTIDYVYRANTEVVTAVTVSSDSDITWDDDATVTFDLGSMGKKEFSFVVPAGEEQVAWVQWTTPSAPAVMAVEVSTSHGTLDKSTVGVEIVELTEITPPDPKGTDRNDSFRLRSPPAGGGEAAPPHNTGTSFSWVVWDAEEAAEEDTAGSSGDGSDSGGDAGAKWTFSSTTYTATIAEGDVAVAPAASAVTSSGGRMPSGYAVVAHVKPAVSGALTDVQTVVATFPEFGFSTYTRLLEQDGSQWVFGANEYSMGKDNVHFTPVWYPDHCNYPVYFEMRDAWTPGGELRLFVEANDITIQNSLFDDWYIGRAK